MEAALNEDWALGRLDAWITAGRQLCISTGRAWVYSSTAKVGELRAMHDQVRRIVHRVLDLDALPDLMPLSHDGRITVLMTGITLCEDAAGRLRTGAETQLYLGSSAPTMAADQLHSNIWSSAKKRWNSGNYSDAVQRAATFLNADIQDKAGRHDVSDSGLMREVFSLSPAAAGKPRLRWPGAEDNLSAQAMRVGILNYSQGIFSAIRNIATHSTAELTRQEAIEQLAALSVLAHWVDVCELLHAE